MLTLQLILQVLLTNEFVKIDCLTYVCMLYDVNNDWTGNKRVGFCFAPRVEIKGCF